MSIVLKEEQNNWILEEYYKLRSCLCKEICEERNEKKVGNPKMSTEITHSLRTKMNH